MLRSLFVVSLVACAASPDGGDDNTSTLGGKADGVACGSPAAGTLRIHVLPPPLGILWDSPESMTYSYALNHQRGNELVAEGRVINPHPIGHVHIEMSCERDGETIFFPLTGMTSDEIPYDGLADGIGILFRSYKGRLDPMNGNAPKIRGDVELRSRDSTLLGIMDFPLTWEECKHIRGYYTSYAGSAAWKTYGTQFRPRGFVGATNAHEGGGCATFGVSFLEVASLLPRSFMTNKWAREKLVGLSRIARAIFGTSYAYGSNFTARKDGVVYTWAANEDIPASRLPTSPLATSWYDESEKDTLNVLPFTLYDPELMFDFIRTTAAQAGAGSWEVSRYNEAHVITRKRGSECNQLKPFIDQTRELYLE